jgi:hypothetical protein
MVKAFNVYLSEDIHNKLKNKCRYYDITMQQVISRILEDFVNSDRFDTLLELPEPLNNNTGE